MNLGISLHAGVPGNSKDTLWSEYKQSMKWMTQGRIETVNTIGCQKKITDQGTKKKDQNIVELFDYAGKTAFDIQVDT